MFMSRFFGTIFDVAADQLSVQRLLSTSSYRQATKSFFTFMVLSNVMVLGLFFLGLAMFSFYGHFPVDRVLDGDTVLFQFIATELPSGVSGIMLSAMLAAVMSTLDSGMNSLAAVATKDVYLRHIRPNASEPQQVSFSRKMTVVVGAISVLLALMITVVSESLGESGLEVGAIWMAFSCVLAPMYLVAVTTTRVSANHVLIGSILGWISTIFNCMVYYL
jgi:SSS family solute:Na+ symporter